MNSEESKLEAEKLEGILINFGEDKEYLYALRKSYKELYTEFHSDYVLPYIGHLEELKKKYNGRVE